MALVTKRVKLKDGTYTEYTYENRNVTFSIQKETVAFYEVLKLEGVNISGMLNEAIRVYALEHFPEYLKDE